MADEANGQFGRFGGRHVPGPLEEPLDQFANAFDEIVPTDEFQAEFREALAHWGGRPTPVYHAASLSAEYGAEISLKRG